MLREFHFFTPFWKDHDCFELYKQMGNISVFVVLLQHKYFSYGMQENSLQFLCICKILFCKQFKKRFKCVIGIIIEHRRYRKNGTLSSGLFNQIQDQSLPYKFPCSIFIMSLENINIFHLSVLNLFVKTSTVQTQSWYIFIKAF